MKAILIISLLLAQLNLIAQSLNKEVFDEKAQANILLGKCDRNGLQAGQYNEWFIREYAAFVPNREIMTKLFSLMKNPQIEIVIVMATWCEDSQREVPRFLQILDNCGFERSNIEIICVNKEKKAPDTDISGFNLQKVPTFIIKVDGAEKGRITETPVKSLEEDLYSILTL